MKKLQIVMIVVLGLLSFAGSFGLNWFRKQKAAAAAVLPITQPAAANAASAGASASTVPTVLSDLQGGGETTGQVGMTERQLQHLIYDVREKVREYELREKTLDEESARIELARKSLQDDIEQLNQLREKLDLTMVSLKEKEEQIQSTVIEIEAIERTNLQRLATTYDKMDAVQAGKIMVSMAANNQLQDVVKILYYMNDRTAAKVLGEIGNTRAEVAAVLSLQLKRVREGG